VTSADVSQSARDVEERSAQIQTLTRRVEEVIVGQERIVERLIIGLLCNGHVLLEGVPGLAKTLTVTTLANAIDANFQRIQFTPDLLPADLVGTLVYNPKTGDFTPRKGPIFANIVLADEINRAPAKVQSALLEAMQERHVTIGDATYPLEDPFLVLATQNPIEQEGTYPLPEAQVDRFMLKIRVTYPTKEEERRIVERMASAQPPRPIESVIHPADIIAARGAAGRVYIDDKIKDYIVDIVHATRAPGEYGLDELARMIEFGASPRATISLAIASRAHAFMQGRGYVTPHDVKSIGLDVLRHRVLVTYEAEAEERTAEDVVQRIFDALPVP
jgi:MoxR-like ATPase